MEQDKSLSGGHRVSATSRVLDFLLAEMDADRLGPSMRLNAARIAQTLNLSVTPVREALGQLAGRGIVDLLPDRGAVIRQMSASDARDIWHVVAALASVGLGGAAEAAARGDDLGVLQQAFEHIIHDRDSPAPIEFLLRLNAWHWEVNRLSGNDFVSVALDRIGVTFWDRFLVRFIDVHGHMDGYRSNYRRIHEAVVAGDGPTAVSAMNFHARWSIALIKEAEAALIPSRRSKPRRPATLA